MDEAPTVDIDKLAALSRIRLAEEEKAVLSGQVAEILGFFQKLQEVDVGDIAPMAHPFEIEGPMRPDQPASPWPARRALANSPAQRDNQVVVPKVVEDA